MHSILPARLMRFDAVTGDAGSVATVVGAGMIRSQAELPVFVGGTLVALDGACLRAAVAAEIAGVVLELSAGWNDVARLSARLAVAEAEAGLADGRIAVLAVAAGPRAVLDLGRTAPLAAARRLAALGVHPAATAAAHARDTARGLVLLAAAAAGVPACDVVADGDPARLADAVRDGFALALVPAR